MIRAPAHVVHALRRYPRRHTRLGEGCDGLGVEEQGGASTTPYTYTQPRWSADQVVALMKAHPTNDFDGMGLTGIARQAGWSVSETQALWNSIAPSVQAAYKPLPPPPPPSQPSVVSIIPPAPQPQPVLPPISIMPPAPQPQVTITDGDVKPPSSGGPSSGGGFLKDFMTSLSTVLTPQPTTSVSVPPVSGLPSVAPVEAGVAGGVGSILGLPPVALLAIAGISLYALAGKKGRR